MNMMEMVLALFAVVFFSSVAMMYNRAVWDQSEYLIHANQYIQCSHLNHSVLDEIDARLFGKYLEFANIKSSYNTVRNVTLQHTGGTFKIQITAVDCDSLGVRLPQPVADNIYVLVSVTTKTAGLKHPVTLERVYTKTHLNI